VVSILTLTDILAYINKHTLFMDKINEKTVENLQLGYRNVVSISRTSKAFEAFLLMHQNEISGVAITDDKARLVGNISASDLKHINYDTEIMKRLSQPVDQYLVASTQKTVPITVHPDSQIKEIIHKMISNHVHRVYVVTPSTGQLLGVISQIDMIELITEQ